MRKLMKFLVRKVPRTILIRYSFIFSGIVSVFYKGNTYQCPICEGRYRKFLPFGNAGEANRLCPGCLSLERHRLLWLYLKEKTGFFTESLNVLHVAPEQPFVKRFRKLSNLNYTTADLVSPLADVKMDIHEIPFPDNTFDVFICNHVLEHVDDELKATKEVFRVLKPGAWAILQVPVDYSLETTYENKAIVTEKDREKHFGQRDHVRLHGKDYPQRLRNAGFRVNEVDYLESFEPNIRDFYRLPKEEIIYLCRKE